MSRPTTTMVVLCLILSCSSPSVCEESADESLVQGLEADLASVMAEISAAEKKSAQYEGGLIKALIEARIETLKNTEALLQQRILTIENGVPTTIQIPVTKPDAARAKDLAAEIESKTREMQAAQREADQYTGGLVRSMKLSTVATHEQTLAMLEQEHLRAKYGLALVSTPGRGDSTSAPAPVRDDSAASQVESSDSARGIVIPRVSNLRLSKQKYEEYVLFDVVWIAQNLKKPARSIKGALLFEDLFGEVKCGVNVTIDEPMEPGQVLPQNGIGFKFNQFRDQHKWIVGNDLEDMKIEFQVTSILYVDGEREDLQP
jgi:hypothetical protein